MNIFGINIPIIGGGGDVGEVASLPDRKELMRRLMAQVKDEVGVFAQQESRLIQLQDRASALSKIGKAQDSAAILLNNARLLLDQQKSLEEEAYARLREGMALQDQLENDPYLKNIATANLSVLGIATLARAAAVARQAAGILSGLAKLRNRMSEHVGAVSRLEKDVAGAEAYVQGRGVKAIVEEGLGGFTSFTGGLLKPALIAGAVVVAWNVSSSFRSAPRASANPRRGRRRNRKRVRR